MENIEQPVNSPASALIGDPARFGRVGDDGTVYVQTPEGERAVGSYPGKTPEEALAYFVRKFEVVAAEVVERCEKENKLRDVNEGAEEVGEELSLLRQSAHSATKAEQAALNTKSKAQSVASKQLADLSNLKSQLSYTQDELAGESKRRYALEKMSNIQL